MHGGYEFLYLQGVSGVILSIIFLKCGGAVRNFGKAYVSSFIAHLLYNFVLVFISWHLFD